MGVFDKFADAPNQIKKEGQEITIRFQRTGPTTGRISWNIPAPAAGCAKDAAQAYDGIVITINGKASNYLSNAPKNATYYTGDATGDADMHAGDKLDGALVVGAFYNDKTTTYLDVNDILPKTPYYVSGYAVDAQARYHREGVHAYSLPTGSDEWGLPDKAAKHDIIIDVIGGVHGSTATGLAIDTEYTLKLLIDKKEYTVLVDGENVSTYTDLVAELKEKLALLGDVFVSPLSPHTNELYYNATTEELKQWDGEKYVSLSVLGHAEDPTMQDINALWFTPSTALLKRHNGATWAVTPYINTPMSPATLACDQTWFDGTNVWLYKLTHWDKLHTYNQTRNPLLAPLLSCDDYWYNSADGSVSVWNVDAKKWDSVNVIYFGTDPNTLDTGAFWYDETTKKVKQYVASAWGVIADVAYLETLPSDTAAYTDAAGGHAFIFDLETQKLFQLFGSTWTEQAIVAFPVDPRDRTKSGLWWDSVSDKLFAWNAVGESSWTEVSSFTQSVINPALPAPVVANSAWYNPETKEIKLVFKTACKTIYPIIFNGEPGNLPVDTVWYDSDDKTWWNWDGTIFNEVFPMYFEVNQQFADPYFVAIGYHWFDETDDLLKRWTGTAWQVVTFVGKPVAIPVGTFWFNSVNDQLYMWDGKVWTESTGLASVELIPPANSRSRSVLSFFTRDIGCASRIEVIMDTGHVLDALTQPVIYTDPESGESGLQGGALYNQLGVGDDGSPDERRAMHDDIRTALGHPVVQVELTKEQLDLCINYGLKELRKFSSYSYKRGVFFLDLKPNQQTYLLTNKCVGFNKVTGINSIHRSRGMAVNTASVDNDAFAYAALQRLYTMGTFDMLSFHLVSAYMEEMETLFANRIMFNWSELDRELGLFSRISRKERVLVDAFFERTEQDLMIDRQTGLWLQRWALAEAKLMLSQSRGKFQSLPGPNGSTQLNASDLQQQARDEMEQLRAQLEDGSMQNLAGIGLRAHFIMG
jgi:hypothetical protein